MPAPSRSLTIVAVAGLVALACSGCGRRGSLQPPETSSVAGPVAQAPASARTLPRSIGPGGTAAADPVAVQDGDELPASAVPVSGTEVPVTTTRGAKRGYTVPKQPFFLDPLL
ncbi:MAG TPA: hypothetical protein VF641_02580 [Methylobacterium sp.]|jgi:predicted small lipoprotein YifL